VSRRCRRRCRCRCCCRRRCRCRRCRRAESALARKSRLTGELVCALQRQRRRVQGAAQAKRQSDCSQARQGAVRRGEAAAGVVCRVVWRARGFVAILQPSARARACVCLADAPRGPQIQTENQVKELLKEISIMNTCESENIVDFYGAFMDKKEVFVSTRARASRAGAHVVCVRCVRERVACCVCACFVLCVCVCFFFC
jgi:hypothetical protein